MARELLKRSAAHRRAPRTKRARVRQVSRWLADKFPTSYPVTLQFVDASFRSGQFGTTARVGRRLLVVINSRMTCDDMVNVLLHEWGHAASWRHERIERTGAHPHHGPAWGVAFAACYSAFWDADGEAESKGY